MSMRKARLRATAPVRVAGLALAAWAVLTAPAAADFTPQGECPVKFARFEVPQEGPNLGSNPDRNSDGFFCAMLTPGGQDVAIDNNLPTARGITAR